MIRKQEIFRNQTDESAVVGRGDVGESTTETPKIKIPLTEVQKESIRGFVC